MNKRIETHVNELFAGMPKDRQIMEVKEELLANLNDKYEDFIANGKSEEEAYSLVVSSIGDIYGLLNDVTDSRRFGYRDVEKKRNLKNLFISIGVSLYVAGVAAIPFFEMFLLSDDVGLAILLLFWGVATGFVVYGANMGKTSYKRADDSFVEKYKEKVSKNDGRSQMKRAVSSSLWSLIVVLYLVISMFTGWWEFTWILFLVGAFLQQLALYFLTDRSRRGPLWHGMLWSMTTIVYFIVSFAFDSWAWSWIIFLIGASIQQIIRLILIWKDTVQNQGG